MIMFHSKITIHNPTVMCVLYSDVFSLSLALSKDMVQETTGKI